MRKEQTRQTLKLRLLALVLALALIWYSLNPAPSGITCRRRDDELPDEKKRNVEPHSRPVTLPLVFDPLGETFEKMPAPDKVVDDFEWPEFIDG